MRMNPKDVSHPPTWPRARVTPGGLVTFGPGRVYGQVRTAEPGRYIAWLEGNFNRGITLSVNRRRIGDVAYRANYPGQWEYVGELELDRGLHDVELNRGGRDLHPGNGDWVHHSLGPLALVRQDPAVGRVRTAPAERAGALCRSDTRLDWIEIVRPRASG
jgi:hypothetical protein